MPKQSRTKSNVRLSPTRPLELGLAEAGSQSLRDLAYEQIKHRIITCSFQPGEVLNEALVSRMLRIGRTPVHQALDRLMLEGLVEVIPRKGVIVKPVSLDEVLQIIDVRLINELYSVRLAAERADATELATMHDILQRAEAATEVRNVKEMMLLDREFHFTMARAAKNLVLSEILRNLHERSLRFWFISLNAPNHHDAVQDQHRRILDAIATRNPDAAEIAMREHIESFQRNITRFL